MPINKKMKKTVAVFHTIEYYVAVKINELQLHATT